MKMNEVTDSSFIKSHGHDPETGKLRVTLKSGRTYEYDDVSMEKYAAFTGAASLGKFYNTRLKGDHVGREIAQRGTGERT